MEAALSANGSRVGIFNLGSGKPAGDNVVNFRTDNRIVEFLQLWRSFAFSDSDIFHYLSASYRSFWLGATCILLARLTGRRIVISFVGGAFKDFVDGMNPLARSIARSTLGLAHAVIACNSDIEEVLKTLLPERRISRMANCFPPLTTNGSILPRNVEEFISSHSPVVTSTGAACTEYGLNGALEAVAELRREYPRIGLVLVLTRYGNAKNERELLDAVGTLALRDHVLIERNLPDFVSLIKRSDALLRSALVDGDSVSVRESLFIGLPTVASDTPFRPKGVILFRKGDPKDMARKLSQALKREKGRTAPEAEKEGEENVEKLLSIYRAVLGPDQPSEPHLRGNSADRRAGT